MRGLGFLFPISPTRIAGAIAGQSFLVIFGLFKNDCDICVAIFTQRKIRNTMATPIMNPFLITGYAAPKYFCDRVSETNAILDTLQNGRNITLTSPRRLGKTGLIKHIFYQLKKQGATVIYIDLYPTESLNDFTQAFASAVLGQLDSNPIKALKKIATVIKGLRPYLTVDPATNQPKVGLDIAIGTETSTLDQVFNYLKRSEKQCYIAFDEFQQIANYPEKNIEAIILVAPNLTCGSLIKIYKANMCSFLTKM